MRVWERTLKWEGRMELNFVAFGMVRVVVGRGGLVCGTLTLGRSHM